MDTPSRSEPVARVGFIGLGAMGGAIAARIVAAGWSTTLWARRPTSLEPFRAENVDRAASPADLAASVDLVGICVWSDDDVLDVLGGRDGVLAGCRPGTVVAIHSTVHPRTCVEIADRAGAGGVVVLDAPVSGGPPAAAQGALALVLGGDAATIDACRSVFETFATTIVHVGDVGAGQVAKLLNNAALAANLAVADDALALGAALGLDEQALVQFLREGSGRSFGLEVATGARTSATTRDAARPALEKDLARLELAAASTPAGELLRTAASIAVERLRNPPAAWTDPKEQS